MLFIIPPPHMTIKPMKYSLNTFSCFLITKTTQFDLSVDYEQFTKDYNYNGNCLFEAPELTMETVAKWPTGCEYVWAILTFNENYDIPNGKLKSIFRNFKFLYGGLRILNTNFKDFSFFPKFETHCDKYGTYILNNSLLENIDFIEFSYPYLKESVDCVFQIANNPKLDTEGICKNPDFSRLLGMDLGFNITDNKVDCGCQGVISPDNQREFENCEKVVGKLVISGFQKEGDGFPSLSKITVINGDLEVFNTSLESLSVLENLEKFRTKANFSNSRVNIDIHDNPGMMRFGMRNLKLINGASNRVNVNFQRLHPNFCLEIEEMILFLQAGAKFINLEAAGYCSLNSSTVLLQNAKVCVFVSMSELDTGCVHLIGNLLIDSGDEEHVGKLNNVIYILGSVTIQNTDLSSCKFLKKLKRIACLDESPSFIPMKILSNSNLKSLNLPDLEIFTSRYAANNRVILSDNHPVLFEKVMDCLRFQYKTQTNVSINGGPCRSIPHNLHGERFDESSVEFVPFDFDFDTDMDYSEDGKDTWYDLYDGMVNVDTETINAIEEFSYYWKTVNDITALVAFLINIVHLIVLLQRELRTSFVYILMMAISLCDLLFAATFITEHLLENGWIYERSDCGDRPKYHVLISRLEAPIQEVTRKSSGVLAFLMALFRTLSVILPTNHLISTVSTAKWAVLMILGVVLIQGAFDAAAFFLCKRKVVRDDTCHETYNEFNGFYVQCIEDEKQRGETDVLQKLMMIDGNFTVFLAILYLIVTIVLLNQLRTARNRRKKSMKSSESQRDNTSLLVTVMAITFFVSEAIYGLFFIVHQNFQKNFETIAALLDSSQVFLWSMVTVNSSIHCLTCFFLSSQYRSAVRKMLRIRVSKAKSQEVMVTATGMATTTRTETERNSF